MVRTVLRWLSRLATIAVFMLFAFWFIAGPNGWFSIGSRQARERRLRAEIAELTRQLEERQRVRDWLANPDSASLRARILLGDLSDSSATR